MAAELKLVVVECPNMAMAEVATLGWQYMCTFHSRSHAAHKSAGLNYWRSRRSCAQGLCAGSVLTL